MPGRIGRLPSWDATTSVEVSRPIVLWEGRNARIVDYEDVGTSNSCGREIIVEWLKSVSINIIDWLNPDPMVQRDLRTVKTRRTVKCARRLNEPPDVRGGISSRCGSRVMVRYASGQSSAKRIVKECASRSSKLCVTREEVMEAHHGAILYFPLAGITDTVRAGIERRRRERMAAGDEGSKNE
jgi:hypothetical protein